jgi:DNA adenine methylase
MILRYPGGKKKAAEHLVQLILHGGADETLQEFREPYCGSAAVALTLLKNPHFHGHVWLNDIDPGIAALWTTVIQNPIELQSLVQGFTPCVAAYREFKESLLSPGAFLTEAQRGFRKLALHQMSFSGLGVRAGSPIGGWDQTGSYKIGCRWHASNIAGKIEKLHQLLKGRCLQDRCTMLDAIQVIEAPPGDEGAQVALYVDPPYVQEGAALYQFGYDSQDQHRQLAESLRKSSYRWVLSYDDDPLVRELYAPFQIQEASWAYTINSQENNAGKELIILKGLQDDQRCSFQALFGF